MIRVARSQPAPSALADQRQMASGKYNHPEVLRRLREDFRNKCYLCEEALISAVEVDHLRPHHDDLELKFGWNNLFYCCRHCNGTKGDKYLQLLDCTDPVTPVLSLVRQFRHVDPELRFRVRAQSRSESDGARETAQLLDDVFNPTSPARRLEAENIIEKVHKECDGLFNLVGRYARTPASAERDKLRGRIEKALAPDTSFTAIRAWHVIDAGFAEDFRDALEALGYSFAGCDAGERV